MVPNKETVKDAQERSLFSKSFIYLSAALVPVSVVVMQLIGSEKLANAQEIKHETLNKLNSLTQKDEVVGPRSHPHVPIIAAPEAVGNQKTTLHQASLNKHRKGKSG